MAISSVTHKQSQTFSMNINSLAHFKAKKEAKKLSSNIIKYYQTKTKLSYIISDNQTDTVRQTSVKNELSILHSIIMVKFKNKLSFRYDKPLIPSKNNLQA